LLHTRIERVTSPSFDQAVQLIIAADANYSSQTVYKCNDHSQISERTTELRSTLHLGRIISGTLLGVGIVDHQLKCLSIRSRTVASLSLLANEEG
jgi:hypothetical protein